MRHKVYISFKKEDEAYKEKIQGIPGLDYVDKSLNDAIDSTNPDYIMRVIRTKYLSDSTVTLFLIGTHSAENLGSTEQQYIKRELQGSLYNSVDNPRNGILGIVLPSMQSMVFQGTYACPVCGKTHNLVKIDDGTTIREFSYNYYIPNGKCSWSQADHYCQLTSWDEFHNDPERYIDTAFNQRYEPIAAKTRVYPKSAGGSAGA